ncbi:MAG: TIGR00341 family protein, partial [Campylobacterota bacterium]|nr:TIGR00341 family protein [Campylobacterota bacterium]
MVKKVFLITSEQRKDTVEFQEIVQHLNIHYKIEVEVKLHCEIILEYSEKTITLLYLSDENIKIFIKNHLSSKMNIGILPTKENPKTIASYGISKDIYEACDDCFQDERLHLIDLLLCNGEPTFTNIIIGDVHGLNNSSIEDKSFIKKTKEFFVNISNLQFKEFTFTTSKEQIIQTAATGIMVLEHNVKHGHYNIINEDFSLHDGKLNAFVLAPVSIISYIYYLFMVFFYSRFSLNNLPKSIGVIKTSKLNINSPKPMDFMLDGILMSSKEIELEILKDTLNISLGRHIKNIPEKIADEDDKDTIKTKSLPKGEMKNTLLTESVPLFKKANEDDFKELFLSLRDSSKLSSIFIVLMVLSTLLATTGLFQSSAPVIIGAMILAPLMSPIVSLSMGIVRGENSLINNSTKTLFYGIVTALIFSCIFTYMMPLSVLTDEMRGRLNPNLLDLMVAVISGIAGAYANSKSEVAKSLAGVAIAVALVPPLSVTGIGIGWMDWNIIYGSFLLFITNLVGITLSAALTFIVLGYAPIHRAKKGIVYTTVLLVIITIPLLISFSKVIKQNNILNQIQNQTYIINNKKIDVNILEVDLSSSKPLIFIQTQSEDILEKDDFEILKNNISNKISEEVV